jgi:hypothetical protein
MSVRTNLGNALTAPTASGGLGPDGADWNTAQVPNTRVRTSRREKAYGPISI